MKRLPALAILLLSACVAPQETDVAQRRAIAPEVTATTRPMASFAPQPTARVQRSNTSIAGDFLELNFRMESGREIPRFTRFETPVRLAVVGAPPATAMRDLDQLIARFRTEAGIDIARSGDAASAQIVVQFLPRATMQSVVPQAACFVVPRVGSWDEFRAARRTGAIDWTTLHVREKATVFIPSDVAPQEMRDCLHEEVAQAMGPLNDLYHLSDSVFNDDNFNTVLTGFDMLVLRAIYSPELRSGMSRAEVAARLPAVLSRINPAGGTVTSTQSTITPRDWVRAIESALTPRSSAGERRAGAERALAIAVENGWTDNRRAFSHFIMGRLTLGSQVEQSVIHFTQAGAFYASLPGGALHQAHVDMQMAAFALSSGQYDEVMRLTERALPAVKQQQNAAILATLGMLRAEGLAGQGRGAEAQAARLDSLGWARYGFGSEAQVRARMSEVTSLAPRRTASNH